MSFRVQPHNGGFFSCCSVLLERLVQYFNSNHRLPDSIDTTVGYFDWYKTEEEKDVDIRTKYFEENNDTVIPYTNTVEYDSGYQFVDYSVLDFAPIMPFIQKYFSPSDEIRGIISRMETKYSLDYENTCVIFFRGNDKYTETALPHYSELYYSACNVFVNNPNVKFLIQSDETEFIEFMLARFPDNSFYFRDEIRHIPRSSTTVDIAMKSMNAEFSKYFLAITMIMSKCKYVVCNSGNCSAWIVLFRGNCENVQQHLKQQYLYNAGNSNLFEKA